jgi:hypothetical protein
MEWRSKCISFQTSWKAHVSLLGSKFTSKWLAYDINLVLKRMKQHEMATDNIDTQETRNQAKDYKKSFKKGVEDRREQTRD